MVEKENTYLYPVIYNLFINYVYFSGKQSPKTLITCFWTTIKITEYMGLYSKHKVQRFLFDIYEMLLCHVLCFLMFLNFNFNISYIYRCYCVRIQSRQTQSITYNKA